MKPAIEPDCSTSNYWLHCELCDGPIGFFELGMAVTGGACPICGVEVELRVVPDYAEVARLWNGIGKGIK